MASELVQLLVQIGTLPPKPANESRQQYAEAIAERLLVYLPSTNMTFNIGGSKPTSDEGPWFKEVTDPKSGNASYELWVWSSTAADYVLLTLNQAQLRYYYGTAAPSQAIYDVWVQVNSAGQPLGVLTYNTTTAAWEPVSYTPTEIDDFFEGETGGGKKQVDWSSLTNVPASASFVPRSVTGALAVGDAEYDWEQVYHTDIGAMVVYDPISAVWKTVDGVIGDLKFVSGALLGTTGDFAAATFNTVLGKNPGWALDTVSQGRVLVGADPTDPWDALTPASFKDPGTTHGADDFIMTTGQLAQHNHTLPTDTGGTVDLQTLTPTPNVDEKPTGSFTGDEGNSDPISLVQKSIAYYCLRKTL